MKNNQIPSTSFGGNSLDELWTPNTSVQPVINLVQNVFGGLTKLDPCNNLSKSFPSEVSYNRTDDGLKQQWKAESVFMHPPQSNLLTWLQKLTYHFAVEDISEAIALVPTEALSQGGIKDIVYSTCSLICSWTGSSGNKMQFTEFFQGRSSVISVDMTFIYWGDSTERFANSFKNSGSVWVPYF